MASKKKGNVAPVVNMDLLKQISEASLAGGFMYVSADDAKPLLDQGLVVQNAQLI